jgi:uncharacterized membrane protein YdcZ (DUF606 family)
MSRLSSVDTVLQNHLDWFPAAVISAMSTRDALSFSTAALAFRVVELVPLALPAWETNRTWNGPAGVYSAQRWQYITGPGGAMLLENAMAQEAPQAAHTIFCTFSVRDQVIPPIIKDGHSYTQERTTRPVRYINLMSLLNHVSFMFLF